MFSHVSSVLVLVGNQDSRPPMVRTASVSDTPPACALSPPAAPTARQASTTLHCWSAEGSSVQAFQSAWKSISLQRGGTYFYGQQSEVQHCFLFIINQYILYKKGQNGV